MSGERAPADVVLIGAGVIGCASALSLADAGARVTVVEGRFPGAEASSAAAGILGAQVEAHHPGPLYELAALSLARYPELAARLEQLTGIDVELRRSGVTEVTLDPPGRARLHAQASWQSAAGLAVEELDAAAIARAEPRVAAGSLYGVRFPGDARVDPPSLVRALHLAGSRAGVVFRTGIAAERVRAAGGAVRAVELADGSEIACAHAVVAAGSWSSLIGGLPEGLPAVRPARGQMVELRTPEPLLRGVVFGPRCYLVPRDDGRTLVGSTMEFVGHDRAVTARAIRDLLDAAIALVPELAGASFVRAWANFRPHTEGGLPLLSTTATRGLVIATGHHRNGILLTPITAAIVRALVLGEPAPVDVGPFSAAAERPL